MYHVAKHLNRSGLDGNDPAKIQQLFEMAYYFFSANYILPMAVGVSVFFVIDLRCRSVPAPYPLRLFTGCLTVFCRREDGGDTERIGTKEQCP